MLLLYNITHRLSVLVIRIFKKIPLTEVSNLVFSRYDEELVIPIIENTPEERDLKVNKITTYIIGLTVHSGVTREAARGPALPFSF